MQFKGIITALSQIQSGTSKSTGKQWRKIDAVLTYDSSKPEYPKAIAFSVMNDNIEKFGLQTGNEYEIEIDFSSREYQGRYYLSASCWKATPVRQTQTSATPQPTQADWQAAYPQPQTKQTEASKSDDGDLPF